MNPYPSTNDCALVLEHNDDGALICMQTARRRYAMSGIRGHYMDPVSGSCCAVGSVMLAAGLKKEPENANFWLDHVDAELRDEARTAIELFDAAAVEIVPTSADYRKNTSYMGPLEWVNETSGWIEEREPDSDEEEEDWSEVRKDMILEIMDHAITKREAELEAREAERRRNAQMMLDIRGGVERDKAEVALVAS